MALGDSITQVSNSLLENPILIKVVTSIIILLVGLVIGRVLGKIILKLLKKLEFDNTIKKATGYEVAFSNFGSKLVTYIIYFLTVLIFLENIGLTPIVLNIIFVLILLIVGVSIILAIKDFIPNFMAGYSLRRKSLFAVGDEIKFGDVKGKITKMNLLDTYMKTKKGELIVIPNSYFTKNMVVKKS